MPRSIEDPLPSHDVNVNGTFNVYRAAAQAHVKRLVFAASSSAYGDTEVLPKVETMLAAPQVAVCCAESSWRVVCQCFQ